VIKLFKMWKFVDAQGKTGAKRIPLHQPSCSAARFAEQRFTPAAALADFGARRGPHFLPEPHRKKEVLRTS
jgi:hypothetical protein